MADQHRPNEHQPVIDVRSPVFASVLKLLLKAALLKIVAEPKCCAKSKRSYRTSDKHEKTNPVVLDEPHAAVSLHTPSALDLSWPGFPYSGQ